jgi:hypothetical protein
MFVLHLDFQKYEESTHILRNVSSGSIADLQRIELSISSFYSPLPIYLNSKNQLQINFGSKAEDDMLFQQQLRMTEALSVDVDLSSFCNYVENYSRKSRE